MNKKINQEKSILLLYIFCIIQIIFVNESAYTLYIFRAYKAAIIFDIILLLFTIYKIFIGKVNFYKLSILMFLFFSIFVINSMIINNDLNTENFLVVNAIINGFIISSIFDIKTYLKVFKNCIIFFCIYGLIVTYIMLPLKMTSFFTLYHNPFTNIPYYNAGFSFVMGWNGLMRLQGIFREPGVFQIYILLAIMIELFIDNKNAKNIGILLVSMIMTFSTSLFVSLIPFLLAYILTQDKGKVKFFIPVLLLLVLLYCNTDIRNYFMRSISKLVVGSTQSTDVRYNSIKYLLETSLRHPIFGNSYVNGYLFIRDYYSLPANYDITGTFFTNIMATGYISGGAIIYIFYKFIKDTFYRKKIIVAFLLFLSLFLSICSQNIVYSSILWTFIFFEIKNMTIERSIKNEK